MTNESFSRVSLFLESSFYYTLKTTQKIEKTEVQT